MQPEVGATDHASSQDEFSSLGRCPALRPSRMRLLEVLGLLKHLLLHSCCTLSCHLELRHLLEHWHPAVKHILLLLGCTALASASGRGARELSHIIGRQGPSGREDRELLVGDVVDARSWRRQGRPSLLALERLERLSIGVDRQPLLVDILDRLLDVLSWKGLSIGGHRLAFGVHVLHLLAQKLAVGGNWLAFGIHILHGLPTCICELNSLAVRGDVVHLLILRLLDVLERLTVGGDVLRVLLLLRLEIWRRLPTCHVLNTLVCNILNLLPAVRHMVNLLIGWSVLQGLSSALGDVLHRRGVQSHLARVKTSLGLLCCVAHSGSAPLFEECCAG